jgi:hypothetical protein
MADLSPKSIRSAVNTRATALEKERSTFEPHWRDLSQHLLPRRGKFHNEGQREHNAGGKKNQRIVNGTPLKALAICASGMNTSLTSKARPWFTLAVADPLMMDFAPVKRWLDDTAQRMRDVLARSNFYNCLQPMYSELTAFGTAPMAMLEDDKDVVRFQNFTVGSYWLGQDARLKVDTFLRKPVMSVGQLVQRYGLRNLRGETRQRYEAGKVDEAVPLLHMIQPNWDFMPGYTDMRGMPFRSVVFEMGADCEAPPLEDKGFHEFPILAGRWATMEETAYGSDCPGMQALGDCRQLQFTETKAAEILDKGNTPPLQAPGALQNKGISLFPGSIAFRPPTQNGDATVSPIYTPDPRFYQFTENKIEIIERRIGGYFFNDLFMMLGNLDGVQPRNQMELADRREEKMLQLGPVVENLDGDVFDMAIDRLFGIMWRRGLFAPPPPELEGLPLKVEYVSVLHQAQKSLATGNMERFAMFVGQLAQTYGPGALDKVLVDQLVDDYGTAAGVSANLIASDEEVAAIREGRAKAKQMEQIAAMAPAMKDGVDALAKGASTVPQEGSLLSGVAEAMS